MTAPTPHRLEKASSSTANATRYVHLLYTSLDDGSGTPGGWQVKEETEDITRAEREALTARIVTRFDVGAPLPTFPTPEQIAARPARLMYARLSPGAAAYWHTVDAGNDATGRPGNVFAHVMLDRAVDSDPHLRPIQLWGSPQWLRPYGSSDVASAALPSHVAAQTNPNINAPAAIAFLSDTSTDRQTVFRVLLDAVSAAMTGGPGVVLLTADLDSGPRWISAVSHFMSPGTARRFNWSTHDDPALARTDLDRGLHLVVVAQDRAADLDTARAIVIDEREEPSLGQPGSTHHLTSGEVTVTGWSVLAEGVLADEATAARLLSEQDRIAIAVGDHTLSPVWPLAVAVRSHDDLAEFHRDADLVVADEAPTDPTGEAADIVSVSTEATAPKTAPDALQRLMAAVQRRARVDVAAGRLLHLGLVDDVWRSGPALADVPIEPVVDLNTVHPAPGVFLPQADVDEPAEALHQTLRLAELVVRLGQPDQTTGQVLQQLSATLTAAQLTCLSESPARYVEDAAIGGVTREVVLRPALSRQTAQLRSSLALATWRWLFNQNDGLPTVPANPPSYDGVLLPHYAASALDAAYAHGGLPDGADQVAAEAIYAALGADDMPDEECRDLVIQLQRYTTLPAEELTELFRRWPDRIPLSAALRALLFEPPSEPLLSAITHQAHRDAQGWDAVAIAAAQFRVLGSMPPPWPPEMVEMAVRRSVPWLLRRLPADYVNRLAEDLVDVMVTLFTVGQLRGEALCDTTTAAARSLKERVAVRLPTVTTLLAALTRAGIVEIEQIAALGLLHRIDSELAIETLLDDGSEGPHWTETVIASLVDQDSYRGPSDAAALRDAAWPQVRTMTAARAETFFAGYEHAARTWLRSVRGGETEGSRWTFRRLS